MLFVRFSTPARAAPLVKIAEKRNVERVEGGRLNKRRRREKRRGTKGGAYLCAIMGKPFLFARMILTMDPLVLLSSCRLHLWMVVKMRESV
jgi:hypothetical protein